MRSAEAEIDCCYEIKTQTVPMLPHTTIKVNLWSAGHFSHFNGANRDALNRDKHFDKLCALVAFLNVNIY